MAFDSTQVKSIFSSKTFYGAVIALLSVLFPHVYANLGITDANAAALVDKIVGGFGGILAIYGRFSATQSVSLTGK